MEKSVTVNGEKQVVNLEMNLIESSIVYNKEVLYKMYETKGGITTAKKYKAKQHITIEVFTINNVPYNVERHVNYKVNRNGGLITSYHSIYNNEVFRSDKKIIESILNN